MSTSMQRRELLGGTKHHKLKKLALLQSMTTTYCIESTYDPMLLLLFKHPDHYPDREQTGLETFE